MRRNHPTSVPGQDLSTLASAAFLSSNESHVSPTTLFFSRLTRGIIRADGPLLHVSLRCVRCRTLHGV